MITGIIPPNWPEIEREYRLGQLSIATICVTFHLTREALLRRATQEGWTRSMQAEVREATREEIIRRTEPPIGDDDVSPVDRAAARAADVVIRHRTDIDKLRQLANKQLDVMARLIENDYPDEDDNGRSALRAADSATLSKSDGTIAGLSRLTEVYAKLIVLERQAFDLDNDAKPLDPEDVSKQVDEIKKELARRGVAIPNSGRPVIGIIQGREATQPN